MVWWRRVGASLTSLAKRIRVPGWVRTALGVVMLVVVAGFFARRAGQTISQVRQAWQPVSWVYVALSFASLFVCLLAMALMWYGLLRTLKGELPVLTAVRFYGLTLLPRYVPGMVWGYVGRTMLCERAGVPRKLALGSVVAEAGLILTSGTILVSLRYIGWRWAFLLALPGVILLLGLATASFIDRRHWVSRLTTGSIGYAWMLAYVAFWLLYGLSTWFAVLSVAPQTSSAELPGVATSTILAWLGGFLVVIVPGGLGIREGVLALALTPIIGPEKGLLVPLLARLVGLAAEAVFFLCCLLLLPNRDVGPVQQAEL